MPEQVLSSVLDGLRAAENLSADARAVTAAALRGPEQLRDVIAAIPGSGISDCVAEEDVATAAAGRMYLTRVSVCGFRGIATRVTLELQPTPGLVLVTGRNGSGKSSVAEAAELALAGSTNRASSTLWKEGLHNLHYEGSAEAEIGLRIDGVGDVTVACELDGDQLTQLRTKARRGAELYDLAVHGWHDATSRYRPVLAYGELSALASVKPSELFDPINKIVGLDGLTAADKLLTQAATEQNCVLKEADAKREKLLDALACKDNPRIAELYSALKGSSPNVYAARAVLAGITGTMGAPRKTFTAWAGLTPPEPAQARAAADVLTQALDRGRRAAAGATGRAKRLADMLDMAIAHREHDDDLCPVCGQGQLDDVWLADAHQRMQEAREQALETEMAEMELRSARADIRNLLAPVPASLVQGAIGGIDPSLAANAWAALIALDDPNATDGDRDRALAVGLADAADRVAVEVNRLAEAAAQALAAQDTDWEELAEQTGETVYLIETAQAASLRAKTIGEARRWLRDLTKKLRRERVARFADQATAIWEELRQNSNVALEGITLTGANTRREVKLDLTVDGTPGPQAVLSQGELSALGLALFLPRSTADDSPFRFVLIDDPVQSMDPSKVDGLARVLHRLATTRQVIVFTHDDRLLQALRRLALPVTAYIIDRKERSVVTVEPIVEPVDQYLRDADALAKDTILPADLLAVAVSGYCRDAIDETATEIARRRILATGKSVADTDTALGSAATTRALLALALLGDARQTGGQLDNALSDLGPTTRDVVAACVEGVHEPDPAKVKGLLNDTRGLIETLRVAT